MKPTKAMIKAVEEHEMKIDRRTKFHRDFMKGETMNEERRNLRHPIHDAFKDINEGLNEFLK